MMLQHPLVDHRRQYALLINSKNIHLMRWPTQSNTVSLLSSAHLRPSESFDSINCKTRVNDSERHNMQACNSSRTEPPARSVRD